MIKYIRDEEFYSSWWRIDGPNDQTVLIFAEEGSDEGYALAERIDALLKKE